MGTTTRLWDGTRSLGTVPLRWDLELEVHQCGTCGVIWGMDKDYTRARREDHEGWKCPNGHGFVFSGESEKERLAREAQEARDEAARARKRERATRDLLQHESRSHAATRGHLTRAKRKIVAGVCPVPDCKRHFRDLERHVKSKHPDFPTTGLAS